MGSARCCDGNLHSSAARLADLLLLEEEQKVFFFFLKSYHILPSGTIVLLPLMQSFSFTFSFHQFPRRPVLSCGIKTSVYTLFLLLIIFFLVCARLEYKYIRLVTSANNKECEMPGADSCAVMEGENEGDMEDEVVYTKPSILGKLKAIASKVRVTTKAR